MTDTTYNGWKNYPTWNIRLWIDNDQYMLEHIARMAESEPENYDLSKDLEAFFDDLISETRAAQTGFQEDFFRYAYGQVDWYELAQSFHDEYPYSADLTRGKRI